jgi:TetR/AcrR family transcriptional repressor of nem operon
MPPSRAHAESPRARSKAESHERIIRSAARMVRRAGLTATSVPRVMRGAGLTVGGFYAHFRSKRAMDAKVLARAMAEVREQWFHGLEESEGLDWLARVVKRYLSPVHRDDVDGGCVLPATLSELTRADRVTRTALAQAFEQVVTELSAHAGGSDARMAVTPRERALATLALCVGGLTLARALRGHPASDELLRATIKWALPEPSARPSRKASAPSGARAKARGRS